MQILTEQQQINVLRNKCENAQTRIWIASPYIGSLKDVQKIIGGKWLLPSVDCKILTDIDSGFIRQDTFDEFVNNQIEIRSLDSLHAKIYIIDDWCLVTSANLTGTAFLCRYEMGIASNKILEVEKTFQRWWNMATPVKTLLNKPPKVLLEYQDGHTFKKKFKAQPYKSGKQDKYDAICEKYHEFAELYEKITGRNKRMIADSYTLLQEVDYLFNYLYRDHPKKPSHEQFEERQLDNSQRKKEIRKYFKDMCKQYDEYPQHWRLERTRKIQKILSPKAIQKLGWKEAKEVVGYLHCFLPINEARFLNPKNNNIDDIKECWIKLLHTGKIDSSKIQYVKDKLMFFGLSSIREIIGWYYPDDYPLMNDVSECGMRFFGYTI